MAEDIDFEIGHFRMFDGPVPLTLTSDDFESHIVVNVLTSINITYWLVITLSLIVDGRKYGRTFFH